MSDPHLDASDNYNALAENEYNARMECFELCSKGKSLDLENGCVSVCKSPRECTGWKPFA